MTIQGVEAAVKPNRVATAPRRRRLRTGNRMGPTASVIAWIYALLLAIPMYYLVVSAFKSNVEIFTDPFSIPVNWLWSNFSTAWQNTQLGQAMLNSALIVVVAILITLTLAVPAAYALSRSQSRLAQVITGSFAASFLIPPFAALIPTVLLAIAMGLFYTREFQMLFLPAGALPLAILLLTQFMKAIPHELVESASMDGAGHWTILTRIFIPLAMPGIVSVTILQLLGFWNEYIFSLIITGTTPDVRTVQVALPTLVTTTTNFGVLAAGTVVTLIPVYIAYALLQGRMQQALTAGAIKG